MTRTKRLTELERMEIVREAAEGVSTSEFAARFGVTDIVFDKVGRFEASKRSSWVLAARTPSRAYPYSEMAAAHTAAHCAEIHGADPLHAKQIDRAIAVLIETDCLDSAHAALEASQLVAKILKPVSPAC